MERKLRVLVAEDCPDTRETLTQILTLWGCEVCCVADGRKAVETAATFRPRVALLDLGMPGMNGFEAATAIRKLDGLQDVWLVALTGYGHEEARRRAHEAGFDLYVLKATDPEELRRLLLPDSWPKPCAGSAS